MPKSPKRKILICPDCMWTWNNSSDKNEVPCPNCGRKIDARDRREYWKKQIENHPELIVRAKEKFWENPQPNKARKANTKIRFRALMLVGKGNLVCEHCGCNDIRLLEINHKNGEGNKEFKEIGGTTMLYRKIASLERKTDDLNLLCRVCNALHYLELKWSETLPFQILWNK